MHFQFPTQRVDSFLPSSRCLRCASFSARCTQPGGVGVGEQQGQRAVDCATAAHNDSTCQEWSGCMKLHRVQWPPGLCSQLWQMARTWQWISGLWGCLTYHSSCRHQHSHWLWLQAPALSSFSPTRSCYVCRSLFSRAFFFSTFQAKGCNFHPANVSQCKCNPYSALTLSFIYAITALWTNTKRPVWLRWCLPTPEKNQTNGDSAAKKMKYINKDTAHLTRPPEDGSFVFFVFQTNAPWGI